MNTFVDAVVNQEARTENGMKARKSTANAVVDLFYNIGASRGKNVVPAFTAAFVQDRGLALRVAAWARDARGGAALSVQHVTGVPIKFAGVAEKLDGLEPFDAERMASRIWVVGMTCLFLKLKK